MKLKDMIVKREAYVVKAMQGYVPESATGKLFEAVVQQLLADAWEDGFLEGNRSVEASRRRG